MCDESSCTRCRPGTMSGEPWKTQRLFTHQRTGVCTRTREPASVRAPENRRLYAHQRTGVCTRTREPASVHAPENQRLYVHQRTGVCTRTREPASVRTPENRRLYTHQRTGVCTRTREPASVRPLSRQIPTTFTPPMSRYRSLVTWRLDNRVTTLVGMVIAMVTCWLHWAFLWWRAPTEP